MKTPSFWYDTHSPGAAAKATALSSLSALYALGHGIHQRLTPPRKAHIPVICVGNAVAGGSGKTPVALALLDIIRDMNPALNPCFVTRGYGGSWRGPVLVDLATHTASDTGDESLLLAARAHTVVARDRYAGVLFAADQGGDIVLMDDGLQNPGIAKDFSLLVVDGATGFGNGMLLPAGPLRTPVWKALARADAVLILGEDKHAVAALLPPGKPCLKARLLAERPPAPSPAYLAFCGIGQPGNFQASLAEAGLNITEFKAFADHYPYTPADLQDLEQRAASLPARLITTAKDAARLPESFIKRCSVDILSRRFVWDSSSEETLRHCLKPLMS